jgi:DNA-binding PadR family transcriptional regulator
MIRDFFLGFIKIHILYHASKKDVWGVWLIKELKRHGYAVGPSTIYPTLHQLEKMGYLKGKKIVAEGKRKIFYKITTRGLKALGKSKRKIEELVNEVLKNKGASKHE